MRLLTADEMREADRQTIESFGIPGRVLMENAGRGAVRVFLENFPDALNKAVGIAAGRGNNGGDGFVMARCLASMGADVTIFLLSEPARLSGDAAANFGLLSPLNIPVIEIPDVDAFHTLKSRMQKPMLWIDAIFGTGLNSDIRGHYRQIIDFINDSGKPVFSVDIPSGLHADIGQPLGTCIKAHATATFGAAKPGLVMAPGCACSGRLSIIDIGIPNQVISEINSTHHLITAEDIRAILPNRPVDTHKGNTGHVLVAACSKGKTGAGALSAIAALRAGAGLVTLAVPDTLAPIIEGLALETMTLALPATADGALSEAGADIILENLNDKQCLALGPGIGTLPETGRMVRRIVENSLSPMVMDADALNLVAQNPKILKNKQAEIVITPHPGEMARLAGTIVADIQADRVGVAKRFAKDFGVCVVLKGARTVIAAPKGDVFINPTGNPGMASAGMGDALTGIIAGIIAQGHDILTAARLGVYIHGAAADILMAETGPGFLASEVIDTIADAVFKIKNKTISDYSQSVFSIVFHNGQAGA
ncbi:MAG: NAD(P)H-hydrate dehydratase [Deltaproteobacteria bacterium]|nr:NAD(P)H-hydrate dehydratase [Deltaproteobacteria bacterium]